MKTVLYVLFYRNRPAVIALVLLLAVRFVQAAALARGALVIGETFGDVYAFSAGRTWGRLCSRRCWLWRSCAPPP